ncbi:penicillin-binding protein activator [Methylocapsa sp. S129]|uniref:penicillin-binding protein activator n=1 Tax=Methylocapsa sp. S129 TaxID=1641869 RepID=UPI00157519DF|nr:penicillin-binding protein activator [Methylocapsa sp. S129]
MSAFASLSNFGRLVARPATLVFAGCAALALAGCGPTGEPSFDNSMAAPTTPVQSQPLNGAAAVGETLGTGPVRIGLILPLTQGSNPSAVGASLRNAAQLAVEESGASDVTLMILDDHSTPEGAAQAAQAAIGAGAELLIGPLFSPSVREVGRIAKAANRPVIAFSTDTSVAARGVYLLSFLIEGYVDRIMDYAKSKGKQSVAAMAPQSDYGNIAVAEFQQAASRLNLRVVTIARYAPGQAAVAAKEIAAVGNQIDALFIPDQADGMDGINAALASNGIKTQILGTGIWNDPRVLKLPALQGAWFAAPENAGFNAFAARYRAKFNTDPTRLATLAYDAVSLVAALARTQGQQRFTEKVLTNASGFNGADGVFRFHLDGPDERGLAVMQIVNGAASVLSPAPRSFAGG